MTERTTPLLAAHEAAGARFREFAGWRHPVRYDGVRAEHAAVRERAGKFDVSHMGEVYVDGPDAVALVDRLTTNDLGSLAPGEAQYTATTREDGVMRDDWVVVRCPPEWPGSVLAVPNAGRASGVARRLRDRAADWGLAATVVDRTDATVLIAVQGPDVGSVVADVCPLDVDGLERFAAVRTTVGGADALVTGTGYTGEDGVEVFLDVGDADVSDRGGNRPTDEGESHAADEGESHAADEGESHAADEGETQSADEGGGQPTGERTDLLAALAALDGGDPVAVWDALDCQPCGLGARDTLRLEMGYLLAGQEFDAESDPRTPFEAGIDFVVDLEGEFVGRDALARGGAADPEERLVGLECEQGAVPRHGYSVQSPDGEDVGTVTSGTMSPTLSTPIALAYLPREWREPGTTVAVEVRGEPIEARVRPTPFLDR